RIVDLAKKMIALSGMRLNMDISIEYSGLRPGEKLFEELWHGNEERLSTHHDKIMIAETSSLSLESINATIDGFKAKEGWDSPSDELSKVIIDFANDSIVSEA
ncbi:MAG: polysaccharide biosynthesis protein, partial [Cyclobacteriaceae bacterium]